MRYLTYVQRVFLSVILSFFVTGCASQDVPPDVVQEVAVTETPSPTPTPVANPIYEKLKSILSAQGYEGIGLEFENDTMLTMLVETFSDPKTSNRQLKTIYTGAKNSYDTKAQSLTIGKSTNAKEILAFIRKSVPLKRVK